MTRRAIHLQVAGQVVNAAAGISAIVSGSYLVGIPGWLTAVALFIASGRSISTYRYYEDGTTLLIGTAGPPVAAAGCTCNEAKTNCRYCPVHGLSGSPYA